jgi:signal transduction histidine kinase
VGLTIVKRFSDRFGWPVRIESRPGEGTRVVVEFPDAVVSGPEED